VRITLKTIKQVRQTLQRDTTTSSKRSSTCLQVLSAHQVQDHGVSQPELALQAHPCASEDTTQVALSCWLIERIKGTSEPVRTLCRSLSPVDWLRETRVQVSQWGHYAGRSLLLIDWEKQEYKWASEETTQVALSCWLIGRSEGTSEPVRTLCRPPSLVDWLRETKVQASLKRQNTLI